MSKPGEFESVRWSWATSDHARMSGYMGMSGRVSVADLINHLQEVAAGVSLDEVLLNFATVRWEREPTPEEVAVAEALQVEHAERTREWERRTLVRLLEKHGLPEVGQ